MTERDTTSPGALAGYRIRIVADAIAGQYAGWLLAGLGAEVERVSVSAPDHVPSPLESWLGSRVTLSRHASLPPLANLARDCDALIVDFGEEVDPRIATGFLRLASNPPGLVALSLSPFGLSGPWSARAAGPQELQALSGLLHATGDPDHPPSPVAGRVVEMTCGANAAHGLVLGLLRRARFGVGSCIDVSGLETLVCLQSSRILAYAYTGLVYRRNNDDNLNNFLPCKDGYVCGTFQFHPFKTTLEFLEVPLSALPRELVEMSDIGQQYAHPQVLAVVKKALLTRTRVEWIERAKPFRIPITPVMSADELVRDEHLQARGFFAPLPVEGRTLRVPGYPFKGPVWAAAKGTLKQAPARPGVDAQPQRRPLEGLRVTEVGLAWSAPMASETFAQYGAEVIKLESPTRLDTARSIALIDLKRREPGWEHMYNYHPVNAGKRHFGFNAAGPGAAEVRARLLAASDVIFTNYSVRALRNLGFDGESIRKLNPRCSVVHSTGFGWEGPYRDRVAYGTGMEGMTGMALETGGSLGPVRSPLLHPDIFASLHQMLAAAAALLQRETGGEGAVIDLGQLECGVLPLFEQLAAKQGGTQERKLSAGRPASTPRARLIRCAGEDEWLSVSPRTDEETRRAETLCQDASSVDKHSLATRLLEASILAAPVLAADEVLQMEQLRARDYFMRVDSEAFGPQLAIGRWHQFRDLPPLRLDGVHRFGMDNESILRDTLGFSAEEILRYNQDGTVGTAPLDPPPPAAVSPVDWMVRVRQIYRWDADFRDRLGLTTRRT